MNGFQGCALGGGSGAKPPTFLPPNPQPPQSFAQGGAFLAGVGGAEEAGWGDGDGLQAGWEWVDVGSLAARFQGGGEGGGLGGGLQFDRVATAEDMRGGEGCLGGGVPVQQMQQGLRDEADDMAAAG